MYYFSFSFFITTLLLSSMSIVLETTKLNFNDAVFIGFYVMKKLKVENKNKIPTHKLTNKMPVK